MRLSSAKAAGLGARVVRAIGSAAIGLALGGCWGPAAWQAARDAEIESATRALAHAGDEGSRARAHAERGRAYSEKARYGQVSRTLPEAECERLFDQAFVDLDRAVELAPDDVAIRMGRGRTWYDRAAMAAPGEPAARKQRAAARADFTRAIELDRRNADALDWRGLVNTSDGDLDAAIADFTAELEFDPRLGRMRLAEAYCRRGMTRQRDGQFELAAVDYDRSLGFGPPADGCDCQADSPLAITYLELGRPDDARRVVQAARRAGRYVAPEVVERLERHPAS